MKLNLLFILGLVVFLFLSWSFVDDNKISDISNESRIQIRMRDIGHQLLLNTGDTSSRVLPIVKLADNTFQIQFESQLTFMPDSLVQIVQNGMSSLNLSNSYIVNVLNCGTSEVVYGFEIYGEKNKDVVPCLGRPLPKQCYEIRVSFNESTRASSSYIYTGTSLIFCLFLAFLIFRKNGKIPESMPSPNLKFISLGETQFFDEKQFLIKGNEKIELTTKENQVLKLLASSPNETISRERLQKEIWEDEGVLVGRSLDVFISKLRKKLEFDSNMQILNVHGKGYKLNLF